MKANEAPEKLYIDLFKGEFNIREYMVSSKVDQLYKSMLINLFPELAESEDERIRKELIDHCIQGSKQRTIVSHKEDYKRWLAWLENQGEQKPAWSEEDETGLGDALWAIQQARTIAKDENDMGNLWYAERWLKSLKEKVQPKQEWSEEADYRIRWIISLLTTMREKGIDDRFGDSVPDDIPDIIAWLKSLRPQSQWKPSELQIEALESATENCAYSEYQDCLRELIEQLKK